MRVLITTWVFPTHGGIFNFLSKMIPRLDKKGHVFHIAAVTPSPGSKRTFPHLPEDRVHNVSQVNLPSPLSFPLLSLLFVMLRVGRRERFDLIFCQDPFYSGFPSLLTSRLLKVRLALADHGMITNFRSDEYWANFGFHAVPLWRLLFMLVMKIVVRAADFIYSPGEDITECMSRLYGQDVASKTCTFPIGIDTDVFRPDARVRESVRSELKLGDTPTAVFVGRLHVESGMEYLIEAIRLLPEESRPKLLIIGDGVLRARYEMEADSKVPGSFMFLGYSERTAEYLTAADLFVFPKIFAGGYSVALREAMGAGLASIATSGVDSHDAIIRNEENGILVPPRDAAAISTAITRLLSDEDLRNKMSERARTSIIDKFGIQAFDEKIEVLLTR